ncbi:MAG: lysine biosynthesis protein LysX [Cenarchaeum sp. SB0663_bin_5]|nr:lysine biosynthesis protein LysX [Cenarchaeum sp. SB0663_bin_5]MYH04316.1 lysine biosynthesis protein LysX [Cenarchaeum sp. SB0675_bin_21]MYL11082.1 lysine biosynthesis protein LysX [Cenarchaeum sp. SB0669_bin_11]
MNPDIAILYDTIRWEEKALLASAKDMGVTISMVNCKGLHLDLEGKTDKFGVVLQRCVSYYRNVHSTAALEGMGVDVINCHMTGILAGNKLYSHMLLKNAGVPTPKATVSFSQEAALKALDEIGYPAVIKPTVGSWGRLISKINDPEIAGSILESRESMYPIYQIHYIEEFVKRPPRDIRAIMVGDEIVAAIYRTSHDNMWKTNTALGGTADPCPVTPEMEEMCIKASNAVSGKIVGVDLMESDDGLLVHEVNNTTEFKNTVRVTGIDIAGAMIKYAIQRARR